MTAAPSAWDIEIAARTVWDEARGEGDDGMVAVASAIINRFRAGKWFSGKTLAECCLMPGAFSCWNTGDPNLPQGLHVPESDDLLDFCREAVRGAIEDRGPDPTNGATHYYAVGTPEPAWVSGIRAGVRVAPAAVYCVRAGRHLFYKDVK